ncbi:hypothetical protein [uncultured Stenotrophomonas sp.]|uniref:hypothetical protein n=1 Tax=uncultured Stenotrophomonas sp. TaxID=165438 RepID=UPI0028E737C2|nr:hypothetical protein [uncultured Stenotrophomonas sp.]
MAACREEAELLDDLEEADDVIFLLSTDWFASWIVSLGQWNGGEASLEQTKNVARRAASAILSRVSDYHQVNLSHTRMAATFDKLMKDLTPRLDKTESTDLCRLVRSTAGHSVLSRDQKWALKAALIREMACGFSDDAHAALGEGVVLVVIGSLELLGVGEIPFQPESRWDLDLDGKFGSLTGRLEDCALANYAPNVILQEVADATRRLQYSPQDVERLADWWAGATQHFRMNVDPRSLALLLTELGERAGDSWTVELFQVIVGPGFFEVVLKPIVS